MRKYRLILSVLFCTVELLLGVWLHTSGGALAAHCSYAAVWLAFLFCFLSAERSAAYLFTQIALLFTVAADSILVYGYKECENSG